MNVMMTLRTTLMIALACLQQLHMTVQECAAGRSAVHFASLSLLQR